MTHEELVEAVAEGIYVKHCGSHTQSALQEWRWLVTGTGSMADDFRRQAREAVKITGEALLAQQMQTPTAITGPVVSAHEIKSLTQGTKT